jgi:3-hydroxymyristoyl/3-hydroxydecanoyl-(acyl carrier protein) dehydratase
MIIGKSSNIQITLNRKTPYFGHFQNQPINAGIANLEFMLLNLT